MKNLYTRLLAGLLLLTPSLAHPRRVEVDEVDVVVVGAGLSGLAAARKLLDAGKTVRLIESRNRVGGRIENKPLQNAGVTELGAAFVGPTQDRVLALAEELGIATFLEYDTGDNLAFGNRQLQICGGHPLISVLLNTSRGSADNL